MAAARDRGGTTVRVIGSLKERNRVIEPLDPYGRRVAALQPAHY
jgi:hypothetical protein